MKKLFFGLALIAFSGVAFGSCIVCAKCTFYPDGHQYCEDCHVVEICPH